MSEEQLNKSDECIASGESATATVEACPVECAEVKTSQRAAGKKWLLRLVTLVLSLLAVGLIFLSYDRPWTLWVGGLFYLLSFYPTAKTYMRLRSSFSFVGFLALLFIALIAMSICFYIFRNFQILLGIHYYLITVGYLGVTVFLCIGGYVFFRALIQNAVHPLIVSRLGIAATLEAVEPALENFAANQNDSTDSKKPKAQTRRHGFFPWLGFIFIYSLITMLVYSVFIEAKHISVEEVSLPILPEGHPLIGKRIAFTSDWHLGIAVPDKFIRKALRKTGELKPDMILFGGDYVTHFGKAFLPVMDDLKKLHAPMGKFAVLGNHDNWYVAPEIKQWMSQCDVRVLSCENVQFGGGRNGLALVGLGDFMTEKVDLDKAWSGIDPGTPVMVLTHNARTLKEICYPMGYRPEALFAGHTHGLQFNIPFLRDWYAKRFHMQEVAGEYKEEDTILYVSRGLGEVGLAGRFLCPSEITVFTLQAKTKK